jgi:hypothetical protein
VTETSSGAGHSGDFRAPQVRRRALVEAIEALSPRTALVYAVLQAHATAAGEVRGLSVRRLGDLAGVRVNHLTARHLPALYRAGVVERLEGRAGAGRGHVGAWRVAVPLTPVDNPAENGPTMGLFQGENSPTMGLFPGAKTVPPWDPQLVNRELVKKDARARDEPLRTPPAAYRAARAAASLPRGHPSARRRLEPPPAPVVTPERLEVEREPSGLSAAQVERARARAKRLGWAR